MSYHPPIFFRNRHLSTIYPSLLRKVPTMPYSHERIATPDQDFLDLDWLCQGSDQLVIISHGLEGNTARPYVRGMAKAFYGCGFDVLAWNFRGCSGEINRSLRFYHSGATDDLETVTAHAISKKYGNINLVGFSLGGNLTLKFLGEKGQGLPAQVRKAVTFSTPFDLYTSCIQISRPSNWIYSQRFLRSLKEKVTQKSKTHDVIDTRGIEKIKTLQAFDDRFTAPLHGFRDARDYYQQCSSIHFTSNIKIRTLVINALNDPFLSPACYPSPAAIQNNLVQAEYPRYGGHVGFTLFNQNGLYWSELKAIEFIQSV